MGIFFPPPIYCKKMRQIVEGWAEPHSELNQTTFGWRQPSVDNDLQWNTNFSRRWPLVEDELCWNANFGGRQPLVEDYLQWWLLPLTVTAQLSPNRNCYQLSQPEIEFFLIEKCMEGGRIIGPIMHHSSLRRKMAEWMKTSWGWSCAKLKFSLVEVEMEVEVGV